MCICIILHLAASSLCDKVNEKARHWPGYLHVTGTGRYEDLALHRNNTPQCWLNVTTGLLHYGALQAAARSSRDKVTGDVHEDTGYLRARARIRS